jgi:hypothetical protein
MLLLLVQLQQQHVMLQLSLRMQLLRATAAANAASSKQHCCLLLLLLLDCRPSRGTCHGVVAPEPTSCIHKDRRRGPVGVVHQHTPAASRPKVLLLLGLLGLGGWLLGTSAPGHLDAGCAAVGASPAAVLPARLALHCGDMLWGLQQLWAQQRRWWCVCCLIPHQGAPGLWGGSNGQLLLLLLLLVLQ